MLRQAAALVILALPLGRAGEAQAIEEPAYQVVSTIGDIEIRRYASYLVAETMVEGIADRNDAANAGFRRLFSYISGDNSTNADIAMTAPVQQAPLVPSMAAPAARQQTQADDGWRVAFVVPSGFNKDTVPKPANPEVHIREIPETVMAVLRYSGRWTDANFFKHREELLARLDKAGVTTQGEVISAAYNAPFSLPFMRRNEVMVKVTHQ
jgi:hypothetical protein